MMQRICYDSEEETRRDDFFFLHHNRKFHLIYMTSTQKAKEGKKISKHGKINMYFGLN